MPDMSDLDQAISEDIPLPPLSSPQPVKSAPAEAPGPVEQDPPALLGLPGSSCLSQSFNNQNTISGSAD